jgi:hypothetical protein
MLTVESNDEDNGAPNPGPELARLLRRLADDIEGRTTAGRGALIDTNGNEAGTWTLTRR